MKIQKHYHVAVTILLILFSASAPSAHALDVIVKVPIPFSFQVGGKLLAAGDYTFKRITSSPELIIIEGPNQATVFALTGLHATNEAPTRFSLIFREYGEQRFLGEVKAGYGSYQFSFNLSRAERELARTTTPRLIRLTSTDATRITVTN